MGKEMDNEGQLRKICLKKKVPEEKVALINNERETVTNVDLCKYLGMHFYWRAKLKLHVHQ